MEGDAQETPVVEGTEEEEEKEEKDVVTNPDEAMPNNDMGTGDNN